MRKLRAAVYARHSTDKQNAASSTDQAAACRDLVRQLDAEVVETYETRRYPAIGGTGRD